MSKIFAYIGKNGEKELFLPCENEVFSVLSDGDIDNASSLSNIHSRETLFSNESALLLDCLCSMEEKSKTALLFKLSQSVIGNISFAFCPKEENALYCKSGISLLFIGISQTGIFLSNDFEALVPFCEKYTVLKNAQMAKLTKDKALIFDSKRRRIKPSFAPINKGRADINSFQSIDKEYCCSAMAQETFIKLVKSGQIAFDYLKLNRKLLNRLNKVILIGSASSKTTALACRGLFENLCFIDSCALESEEFLFSKKPIDKNALVIAISHSGNNKTTLEAVSKAKEMGAKTVALTDNINSALALESNYLICPRRKFQNELPASARFISDYLALCLFALYLGYKTNVISDLFLGVSVKMAEMLSGIIFSCSKPSAALKSAADEIRSTKNIFVCSAGDNLFAEKIAEIIREESDKTAFPLSLSELKKLSDSIISDSVFLALINDKEKLQSKNKKLLEIKKRGGRIFVITNQSIAGELSGFENILTYNDSLPVFAPLPCVAIIYQTALLAGKKEENNEEIQSA